MKRPSVVIAISGLVGLVAGVAFGLMTAAGSHCEVDFVPEGGTCYRYFGRYFSDATYYAVSVGLWGLGIGLAVGLFIVTRRWLRRRDLSSN